MVIIIGANSLHRALDTLGPEVKTLKKAQHLDIIGAYAQLLPKKPQKGSSNSS